MIPATLTRLEVLTLLGLTGASWGPWHTVAKVLDGTPLTSGERAIYEQCTGRSRRPSEPPAELVVIKGRRCGGTRVGGALVVHAAGFTDYADRLAPGERAVIGVAASDRAQAKVALGYAVAPFTEDAGLRPLVRPRSVWDTLRGLVTRQTRWGVDLTTGVSVEVHTAHFGKVRGRTFALLLADEVSFWQREDGSNPASEVLAAVRPGLVTLGGRLLVITTPYAKHGPVWDAFEAYYGREDAPVLVWKAASRVMNPTIPERVVLDALERDEASARAEWLGEFRSDVESFISREAIARVVMPGRTELPPRCHEPDAGEYLAFVDPAGGAGQDSMTLAIAHVEQEQDEAGALGRVLVVVDVIRETKPPFDPSTVVRDFAALVRAYGATVVHGDRYGGEWVAGAFTARGVAYAPCARSKSDLYRDFLPLVTTASVELLDHPRLVQQLHGLERHAGAAGRDHVDHARAGHDDVINSVAGAAVLISAAAAWPEPRLVSLG